MNEELFKQNIKCAKWVSEEQKQVAEKLYQKYLRQLRKEKSKSLSNIVPRDIVPYDIRINTIEALVTHPELKELIWEKAGKYMVVETINGLFIRYFGRNGHYRHIYSQITKVERDKKLERASECLKEIQKIFHSDASLEWTYTIAFQKALTAAKVKTDSYVSEAFIPSLIKNLKETPKTIKTHDHMPHSPKDKRGIERGIFINGVSNLVTVLHGRPSHKKTAMILNILRPDLGPFKADNIRKWKNQRSKTE